MSPRGQGSPDRPVLRTPAEVTRFIRQQGPFARAIWDFDGVIGDTEPAQAASYVAVLAARGVTPPGGFFDRYVGLTEPEIWAGLAADLGIADDRSVLAVERLADLVPRLVRDVPPNWFVEPALATLEAGATPSVIVSSGNQPVIEAWLAATGLARRFATVSALGADRRPKRDRAAELLAGGDGRVVLFEDVDDYLALGRAHGALAIGVEHGFNRGRLPSAQAVIVVSGRRAPLHPPPSDG